MIKYIIVFCLKYSGLIFSIVRKTFPALRATVFRDFKEILEDAGLWDEKYLNKTEFTYYLNGNLIEFFSVDQSQKIRGRKRHFLFCNEVNELTLEDWRQLLFRTTGRIIIDYNPSMSPDHFVYNDVLTRKDCKKLVTTYKDNPYLTKEQINEIELLRTTDPDYWKIYGEGQPGVIRGLVFKNWKTFSDTDSFSVTGEYFGLDFGFSPDPTVLSMVGIKDNNLYAKELIYQNELTTSDLIDIMRRMNLKRLPIYCDNARNDIIKELRNAGFDARPAKKGTNSIQYGIDLLKRFNIFIHEDSLNAIKEARNYKYKIDANGNPLPVPVDKFNHFWDSLRYVVRMVVAQPKFSINRKV